MRLTRLNTFLRWARARGYIAEPPPVEKVKESRRVPRVPLEEHIRALWARLRHLSTAHPDPRQRYFYGLHLMMLLFVVGTGVRRAGPFHAKWEHVDFAGAAVLLVKSKGGEEWLNLPPLLVAFLRERRARYPHHVWLFDNGRGKLAYSDPHAISTAFRRHQAALGFAGLRIKPLHGFRALFATVNMNELGADSKTVAELLNHASFKTTENAYLAGMAKAKRRALVAYEEQYLAGLLEGGLPEFEAGGSAGAGS